MNRFLLKALAGIAVCCGTAHAQSGQAACQRLSSFHNGESRVLTADYVSAGPFQPPSMGTVNPGPITLPAHCSVRILTPTSSDSAVTSEIWLPEPGAWNGKLLGTGNGGYSSMLSYREMADGLGRGFAVGGSDTGHQGDGLSFGAGHPEEIRDWAYRSTHVLAQDAKALVVAFYGKTAAHAYFVGCSTGGQQALSEAQRYPEDFDGIVAGDPGNDRILLNADFVESWRVTHPALGAAFPLSKLPLLHHAVTAACGKQDGVSEDIVSYPRACSFDPGSLKCGANADMTSCLTDTEVRMVRQLYDGAVRDGQGKPMYPGWPRGSEAGWGAYLVSPSKPVRLEFWSSWVFDSPSFGVQGFGAEHAVAAARAKIPYVEAVDPDLRPFQRGGGKLLMYHGWADPVVPPEDTIDYYQQVKKVLGPATENSIRLFLVPGMGHCGGGPGASVFDTIGALDQWVTGAAIPDSIIASHKEGDKFSFERRLCPFPQVAHWDGHNDPAKASNFHCTVGQRK